jgi:hypothetical protein
MKKKILAIIALMLILAMESVTVFATEGNPGGRPGQGNIGGAAGPENQQPGNQGGQGNPNQPTDPNAPINPGNTAQPGNPIYPDGWFGDNGPTIDGSASSEAPRYLYGSVGGNNNFIWITIGPNDRSERFDPNIGMVQNGNAQFGGLSEDQLNAIRYKVSELDTRARARGFNTVDAIGFDVDSDETSMIMQFID